MVQWVKDLALLLLWLKFSPWPGNSKCSGYNQTITTIAATTTTIPPPKKNLSKYEVIIYILLYIKYITNKGLLYSMGNYTQYFAITSKGKES